MRDNCVNRPAYVTDAATGIDDVQRGPRNLLQCVMELPIHHVMVLLSMTMQAFLCISCLLCTVCGSGQFWIRLISYQNPDGTGSNGHPCDGKMFGGCDHRFIVCVDDSFNLINSERCKYGRKDAGEIPDSDSINFLGRAGQLQDPLIYQFSKWPGSVAVKIRITYADDNTDDDVDFFSKVFIGKPALNVSESKYISFDLSSKTSMKTEVKVFCNMHFYGDDCAVFCVPRDDDFNGHYICDYSGQKLCLHGWTGLNCDVAVDICGQNPCQNGGTCFRQGKNVSCLCPPDFNGETCGDLIEKCNPSPCLNGGTCINIKGSFKCNCPPGFVGATCSEGEEKCRVQCHNNGTCVKTNGVPFCVCTSGWTGQQCEDDLDECKYAPCKNNALCINTRGNFYCKCTNGFTGRTCHKITNCAQCFGTAKCNFSRRENSLVCVCPDGYTGSLCNVKEATNCIVSRCHNNGTCVVRGDQYTCQCPSGWTGETCANEILSLKEECHDGACGSDHCSNPNGTSSFLLKGQINDAFKYKLLEVLKEYIVLDSATVTVNLIHNAVKESGTSSPINVTLNVFINNTKVCPDNVDDLLQSFDVHDLDFLGILRDDSVLSPAPHYPEHFSNEHWRIGVIAFTIIVVVIGLTFTLLYLCKRRSRALPNTTSDFEPSTTATFENQTYTEIQPLNKE